MEYDRRAGHLRPSVILPKITTSHALQAAACGRGLAGLAMANLTPGGPQICHTHCTPAGCVCAIPAFAACGRSAMLCTPMRCLPVLNIKSTSKCSKWLPCVSQICHACTPAARVAVQPLPGERMQFLLFRNQNSLSLTKIM